MTTIPIPDLALLVLADFKDGDGWHKGNWMNAAKQFHAQHIRHANVGNHLWEAWAWLDAHARSSPAAWTKTLQTRGAAPKRVKGHSNLGLHDFMPPRGSRSSFETSW